MGNSTRICKVIAICGSSSGVGKSTLVSKLTQLIPDSASMFFDAYQQTTEFPPNLFKDLVDGNYVDPKLIRSILFYMKIYVHYVMEKDLLLILGKERFNQLNT